MFQEIYPDDLELKTEHQGTSASFLNLDINISDNCFVYKLFDKRDAFPFVIVRMPYMCSNIPNKIFYSALVGEFLRIARSTLKVADFIPKASLLISRLLKQGGDAFKMKRKLAKMIDKHPKSFQQFHMPKDQLINVCFSEVV